MQPFIVHRLDNSIIHLLSSYFDSSFTFYWNKDVWHLRIGENGLVFSWISRNINVGPSEFIVLLITIWDFYLGVDNMALSLISFMQQRCNTVNFFMRRKLTIKLLLKSLAILADHKCQIFYFNIFFWILAMFNYHIIQSKSVILIFFNQLNC